MITFDSAIGYSDHILSDGKSLCSRLCMNVV